SSLLRPPLPTLFPYTTLFRSSHYHRSIDLLRSFEGTPTTRSAAVYFSEVGASNVCYLLGGRDEEALFHADEALAIEETAYPQPRSEEHTSELQSLAYLVCRLL